MNITIRCVAAMLLAVASQLAFSNAPTQRADSCVVGTYHLHDGSDVDIALGSESHLRWRRLDGTTGELTRTADGSWTSTRGWTERPDGKRVKFTACGKGGITFDRVAGSKIPLKITNTRFRSAGVDLAGRLVMPPGDVRVPIVVLVHGSEDSSALDYYALQRIFPSQRIGAFVYDKRGTGASKGAFTADYALLAKDAVAAMHEAKRLAGRRAGKVGYQGSSQGGWVAPLAATYAPVDFVVVGYGLAVSPVEEDRSAIALDMTRRGYGPEVMAKAMEVADATEIVIASGFKDGYDRVGALRAKYGGEPWFQYVHGDISFVILQMSHDRARALGAKLAFGIQPYYDPMPVLQELQTPQLWILGEDDTDAPSAETIRRLNVLARDGHPIVTAVFPKTEHGIYEFEETPLPEGKRTDTRNPDGYYAMMCDFIRTGSVKAHYGSSVILNPQLTSPPPSDR